MSITPEEETIQEPTAAAEEASAQLREPTNGEGVREPTNNEEIQREPTNEG